MVGIESRKLNSRAVDRVNPTTWPEAMVDMEREVPGNTGAKVWHSPITMACHRLISSTSATPPSCRTVQASMTHITTPPMRRASAMTVRLSRFLLINFLSSSDDAEVKAKAKNVNEMG